MFAYLYGNFYYKEYCFSFFIVFLCNFNDLSEFCTRATPYKGMILNNFDFCHPPYPDIPELSIDSGLKKLQKEYSGSGRINSSNSNNNSNNKLGGGGSDGPLIIDKESKAQLLKRFGIVSAIPSTAISSRTSTTASATHIEPFDSLQVPSIPTPTQTPASSSSPSMKMTSEFYLSSDED